MRLSGPALMGSGGNPGVQAESIEIRHPGVTR